MADIANVELVDKGHKLSPGEAINELAKVLYLKMEHVDPSGDMLEWSELSDYEQDCYRTYIKAILWRGALLKAAAPYCERPATT